MATYAIGDVQGCHAELERLLERLDLDAARDRLWMVGDLVNRGPRSLETLRLVRRLGDAATVVLGNHDLHLLAVAAGAREPRRKDTLDAVLGAPDRDELLAWLRHRPLVVRDREAGRLMVHAGLPPPWDADEADSCARELEAVLRGPDHEAFFHTMYGDHPARWDPALAGAERLRYITNALTRMRYVDAAGALDLDEKGPPGTQSDGLVPWYTHPQRRSRDVKVVFGHWAALQRDAPLDPSHGVVHVDMGCVWGGSLRAVRLEDGAVLEVPGRRRQPAPGEGVRDR